MVAGSNAALTAENPGLEKVLLGIGWDMVPSRGPQAELVPMVIMCGADGRAVSDDHLVFFNQIISPEGSISFAGAEDQDQIDVDLKRVPDGVHKIVVLLYVDPEVRGPGTFGNAMILGELYRHAGGWKFRALGQGYEAGLSAVAADFKLKL